MSSSPGIYPPTLIAEVGSETFGNVTLWPFLRPVYHTQTKKINRQLQILSIPVYAKLHLTLEFLIANTAGPFSLPGILRPPRSVCRLKLPRILPSHQPFDFLIFIFGFLCSFKPVKLGFVSSLNHTDFLCSTHVLKPTPRAPDPLCTGDLGTLSGVLSGALAGFLFGTRVASKHPASRRLSAFSVFNIGQETRPLTHQEGSRGRSQTTWRKTDRNQTKREKKGRAS